jgi:uncharacterized protein
LSVLWGPIIGPIVSIVSIVCSIGNVPLAAVLWNGGISFGGVIAFIYADLLILPILNIYRKYYGTKMMLVLLGTFYVSMVCAGYAVELLFGASGLIPSGRNATVMYTGPRRAVRPHRRRPDAAHDGRCTRHRPRPSRTPPWSRGRGGWPI